jgi:hypothetical protein
MANEEHVALLKQGVKVWNNWREANPIKDYMRQHGCSFPEALDALAAQLSPPTTSDALCRR